MTRSRIFLLVVLLSKTIIATSQFVQVCPNFSWLNKTSGERPTYVWENCEDIIYHELYYPDTLKQTAPELYALMRCPWVFNRAMKWIRSNETIIAYSKEENLPLTGEKQVSAWYSDPSNSITNNGSYSLFEKNNSKRQKDAAVLPAFQFHIAQHPKIQFEVADANTDWQLCISIKGRSGKPIIASEWMTGSQKFTLDIEKALLNAGYHLNYAELHFIVGVWNKNPTHKSKIKFKAILLQQPAIVACLPIIRTENESMKNGIPITAIISNGNKNDEVYANINEKIIKLEKENDLYYTNINGLPAGEYQVKLYSNNKNIKPTQQIIRITDGIFTKYNKSKNYFEHNKTIKKPLTGSYQGSMFFQDCGQQSEKMLLTQNEWNNWDRNTEPGERLHSWESFTEKELQYRFEYLKNNQWDIVHLHSHYGIWERFDAVGNLAPHGVEQFALYTRIAAQNGLKVMITLSSYPYGINTTAWDEGTIPYKQYEEAGFKNEDWYTPQNEPFKSIYHQYLKDFIYTFKSESNILSFSSSGEGDWKGGYKRFLDTKELIQSIDTNHIIVSEPIMHFHKIPSKQVEHFSSDLVGYRNYSLGTKFNADEEMGLYVKLAQILPNSFISEGSYPASNVYTCMTFDEKNQDRNCWVGTNYYRIYLRDWIYFGFIAQMPAIVTWDEVFTEDERIILKKVSQQINWDKPFKKPLVSILINDTLAAWDGRPYLSVFERVFSKLAIDYRFVETKTELEENEWFIDITKNNIKTDTELLQLIPEKIKKSALFNLSEGYSTHYFSSYDSSQIVAYIYNTSAHEKISFYLAGNYQRKPKQCTLKIDNFNINGNYEIQLYNLNDKTLVKNADFIHNEPILIENSESDFLLLLQKK